MPEIIFNGPAGRLEGKYRHSKYRNAPLALILHPNPLQGGTMNNRVSYSLFQTFVNQGFSTLRFNFRGVGRSQGTYDEGEGELCDAAAALDWLQTVNKESTEVWVGGFSFGAYIGMQMLMRRPEIDGYVSISPQTSTYDFSFLAPCPTDGLIVHGSEDSTIDQQSMDKLEERLIEQRGPGGVDIRKIKGADHYFKDSHLDTVISHVNDHITSVRSTQNLKKAA